MFEISISSEYSHFSSPFYVYLFWKHTNKNISTSTNYSYYLCVWCLSFESLVFHFSRLVMVWFILHACRFIFKYFIFLFTSIVILHMLHKVPKKRCPKKKTKQNKMLIITHRMTQKGRFECFKIRTYFVYVYLSLRAVPSYSHFRFFHLFMVISINIVILMSVFIFHCLFVYRFVWNIFYLFLCFMNEYRSIRMNYGSNWTK